MEPIPETAEAVNELGPAADGPKLLGTLTRLASLAQDVVPDLVGVSVAVLAEGVTFTLVASAEVIAVLDAVQYAVGGPCVDGAHSNQVLEFEEGAVLDEERWRVFAEASAAHTVRSTLTLPVVRGGRVLGTVNLYGASRRAFEGQQDQLARIFGGWAAGAMMNADLAFNTRLEAQAAPSRLREQALVDQAVGILAAELSVDVRAAADQLREAAARAGVNMVQLARDIIRARGGQERDED